MDFPHGIGNVWYGWFWLVHYTGAVTADKLVTEGSLLLDGSTGEHLTDAVSFVREIQRIQKQTWADEMSFHAIHAFIWHYVARTIPDLDKYPTQLATEFCGEYVVDDFRSKPARKSIGSECYHGFGHAVFYSLALRQLGVQSHEIDVRTQLRPGGGFQLSDEIFCEAYKLCAGAPNATITTLPRKRCIGGVRHSTKLFAILEEDEDPTEYVAKLEERCDVAEQILKGLEW
uniref:Uncharacterized protein n=1 Tax=Grammatophora oceanica TaxID=210454 RepID=A0A7S1YCQ1_9STRA|mmetsp:Transcript_39801/g.59050  ORF Transcript_39801/g.59050 Transcript_39801/m.59050 type:complete len:230 (+) Transcript_39801:85-774(+)